MKYPQLQIIIDSLFIQLSNDMNSGFGCLVRINLDER
jgi:hypothetical protein